jgi:hypothetical protein
VTGEGLDEDVQAELRSLVKETADTVAAHLVAAALLLDDDPEAAYTHAVYARARASRVGSVREAVGIAAYMTGRYTEALSELRAVKRIHGTDVHLPVMADCQRGLGRPERALEMAGSPEAAKLDVAGQIELRIVAAGARQDMGQLDAAVLTLQCPQLRDVSAPWSARLRYAYAEALLTAGRHDEGRTWLVKAVDADVDGQTDAADRLAELDGVSFVELEEIDDLVAAEGAASGPSIDPVASAVTPPAAPSEPAAVPAAAEAPRPDRDAAASPEVEVEVATSEDASVSAAADVDASAEAESEAESEEIEAREAEAEQAEPTDAEPQDEQAEAPEPARKVAPATPAASNEIPAVRFSEGPSDQSTLF